MVLFLICSLLLDGIILNLVSVNSSFIPLISMMSIIVLYIRYRNNNKYYLICFIMGLLYDICFADMLFYHSIIFVGVGIITDFIFRICSLNTINIVLLGLGIIPVYRAITYSYLYIFQLVSFNLNDLLTSIYSSVLINVIYLAVSSYLIFSYRQKRLTRKATNYKVLTGKIGM